MLQSSLRAAGNLSLPSAGPSPCLAGPHKRRTCCLRADPTLRDPGCWPNVGHHSWELQARGWVSKHQGRHPSLPCSSHQAQLSSTQQSDLVPSPANQGPVSAVQAPGSRGGSPQKISDCPMSLASLLQPPPSTPEVAAFQGRGRGRAWGKRHKQNAWR